MITESKLLEDESLVAELRRRRNSTWQFVKSYGFVVLFTAFVTLYVIMVLGEPFNRQRFLRESMRQRFDTDAHVPLNAVDSIPSLWSYFNYTLFPTIMSAKYYYDTSLNFDRIFTQTGVSNTALDHFGTRLIGSRMVVRAFRVRKNEMCPVDHTFESAYLCYPPYTDATEATNNYGIGKRIFQYGRPEILSAFNVTEGGKFSPIKGKMATYNGYGYLLTFGAETMEASAARLDNAINKGFVDLSTRAVSIEFNVWNSNEGYIGVTRILFERGVSGEWQNTFSLDVVSERFITLTFDSIMIVELLVCFLVCVYVGEEISELCIRKFAYVKDAWNVIDWANLIMLMIFMVLRGQCFVHGRGVLDNIVDPDAMYTDLSFFAYYANASKNINAFNTIFVAFKCVKYVSFIPYVETLMVTLGNSWHLFLAFIVIYISVFIGFSLAYSIGFGEKFPELATFRNSNLYLARSYAGDVDLTSVYESSPGLGGLLIVLFIAVMYFLCMNLLYGIILVAFEESKLHLQLTSPEPFSTKFIKKMRLWWEDTQRLMIDEWGWDRYMPRFLAKYFRRLIDKRNGKDADAKDDCVLLTINDGGPCSPHSGRQRKMKPVSKKEVKEDSSSDSEEDLGPLSQSSIRKRKRMELHGDVPTMKEPELFLLAIQHLSSGLQERGCAIQSTLTNEMAELTNICANIHAVVDVIGRRSFDLHTQQQSFLHAQ